MPAAILAVMTNADTLTVMNRLLAILYRSLPLYLHDAQPWRPAVRGDERLHFRLDLFTHHGRYGLSIRLPRLRHAATRSPSAFTLCGRPSTTAISSPA